MDHLTRSSDHSLGHLLQYVVGKYDEAKAAAEASLVAVQGLEQAAAAALAAGGGRPAASDEGSDDDEEDEGGCCAGGREQRKQGTRERRCPVTPQPHCVRSHGTQETGGLLSAAACLPPYLSLSTLNRRRSLSC